MIRFLLILGYLKLDPTNQIDKNREVKAYFNWSRA